MAYVNVYPSRINWENEPSISTPINETNLNKMDYALYQHDRTLENWDTTKANQSDLLLSVKTIDYDDETGVFIFTWQNGTTKTVDLNTEKIPVSFSMSPQGIITMTTDDGTTYTADVGALIKTYTFADSSVIDFTVTTDASGNKTVTADIVDGSIAGSKLQPNYLADCQAAQTGAETAQGLSEDSAEDAEAWAVGQRNGSDVPSTDPTYHNNSKYYSELANPTSIANLTDVDITGITNGQILKYNSTTQKFENANESGGGGTAASVTYDNTVSGLTADDVQEAIDELNTIKASTTTVNNKHKVTNLSVTTAGWTTDTTSQSGSTLYKKQITLNHIYVDSPSVEIGAASGSVLPTTAQQEAYDLIQYVTVDTTVPCLYLYASDIPTDGFYINVEGVD